MAQVLRPDAGELEVRIQARPETVFEFFVDPDKMKRWKGTEAELDPRPGGTYRVGGIAGGATVVGEFVEIDPPRRLVFTWGWEGDDEVPPGSSTVEVTLTPDGDATVLHLVHRDLPAGQGPRHLEGWEHFVPRLVEAATGRDPGPGALVDVRSDVTVVSAVRGKEGPMGAPVVHFEIYGKDASKLQSFYADLFGWEIHADNPMNYGIVHTNTGDKGIGGGITEGDARVNVVVDVDDLQKYLDKAVSMGGEVVTPITEIPDMVTWAEFRDPAGNVIGISLADS